MSEQCRSSPPRGAESSVLFGPIARGGRGRTEGYDYDYDCDCCDSSDCTDYDCGFASSCDHAVA